MIPAAARWGLHWGEELHRAGRAENDQCQFVAHGAADGQICQ